MLPKLLRAIGHDQPRWRRLPLVFKNWCHEERDHRAEVVEQALGHRIKSTVERAYRRGDLLKRREALMLDWENYCSGSQAGDKVIQLRA